MAWWWPTRIASTGKDWDLSTPLLEFAQRDAWSIGDACLGTLITGATGAGKTTGPGAALAMAFLKAGFGGLVLCCKPGERQTWENYARLTGRQADLVVFDASGQHRFCFLDEELQRGGAGAGLTENIVNLLSTVLEVAERNSGKGGREDEGYWRRAMRQLCRNVVDLLIIAKGRITVPDLYQVVISAPTSSEQLSSPKWEQGSFCFQCLREADAAVKSERETRDFELVTDYFVIEYPKLSDKTRSVIVSSFTSMVDILNRSLLHDLFSTYTTVRPEDTLNGRIIIIDLPVKDFAEVGLFSGVLWKFCWQRSVERRDVSVNARPVFLFVDEFQTFSVKYDQQFQTTARSSKAATVYMSQNISNLLAAFGGAEAKALTDSLTGNLNTKIWTANGDPVTNEWASSVIGRSRQYFANGSRSQEPFDWLNLAGLGNSSQASAGFAEHMEFECDSQKFTALRTGGPSNCWEIDAIVFQGGRRFASSRKTWLQTTFRQQL